MQQGDRKRIPTVAEAVNRAAAICDPDAADDAVTSLFESFEDDERPTTAVEDLPGELQSAARAIDPEADSPAVAMTGAAAAWLATNFDQADAHEHVLQEGALLVFGDDAPEAVRTWLSEQGVEAA